MMAELHLFVLWERARYQQEKILADIREHFSIVKLYEISWTPEFVSSNYTRFYGENLPSHSEKEQECGTGPFLLVIVRDEHPNYECRETSHGEELVNTNMFDGKARYRSWTKDGHKIHGTNSPQETNHNLTMLLGKNTEDFLAQTKPDTEHIELLQRDITGARGWRSIQELFYVLNNTVRYVIMRGVNAGEIGDYIDHTDTDILTDQYQNFWYIANGIPCRSTIRPKERVVIDGKNYDLDLWNTERDYYDQKWSAAMLSNRVLQNGYYVLFPEDDFYCLLYHCLINKDAIAPDYEEKLQRYKKQFDIKEEDWYQILVNYLERKSYVILRPDDTSNGFHLENPLLRAYALKFGVLRKRLCEEVDGQLYLSAVYEKNDSYVKKGTPWLIENERRFLKDLQYDSHIPHILAEGEENGEEWIEISKIQGSNVLDFFKAQNKHNTVRNVKAFVSEGIKILMILRDKNIIHRDMMPRNILLSQSEGKLHVGIIDFGWSIYQSELSNAVTPFELGGKYALPEKSSDVYSFAVILKELWPHVQGIQRVIEQLREGKALEDITLHLTCRDYGTLFLMRRRRLYRRMAKLYRKSKQ